MIFKQKEKIQYPSAELLIQPCFEDYKNELESYNKLYDKVNVALAFCGIVLLVFLDNVELSYLTGMLSASSFWGVNKNFIPLALCASSAVLIVLSTIQMLQLMKGSKIRIFDSVYFRNQKLYSLPTNQVALKLIDSFTVSTSDLRKAIAQKQEKYDKAVSTIIIAVLLHAAYLITT